MGPLKEGNFIERLGNLLLKPQNWGTGEGWKQATHLQVTLIILNSMVFTAIVWGQLLLSHARGDEVACGGEGQIKAEFTGNRIYIISLPLNFAK